MQIIVIKGQAVCFTLMLSLFSNLIGRINFHLFKQIGNDSDQTLRSLAPYLGLYCLQMLSE